MAYTALSDLIVPEIWNSYVVEQTAAKSAFLQSGVMVDVSDMIADNGGHSINMPFFTDLTGDDEVAPTDGTTALTPGAIGTAQDVALVINRERAFGAQALAGAMAGSDPMQAIAGLVASYTARQQQKELIASLTGAFAAASMSGNVLDISGASSAAAQKFSAEALIDAQYLLGDNADMLTAIAVHSATKAKMEKNDLLDFEKDSMGGDIVMYRGKRVIVDDSLPVAGGVYTSYLFAPGAVGFASLATPNSVETFREELKNNDGLIIRRRNIIHPRGVAYTGAADGSQANSDLETGTNWTRKYENKNIRIVQFKHKV